MAVVKSLISHKKVFAVHPSSTPDAGPLLELCLPEPVGSMLCRYSDRWALSHRRKASVNGLCLTGLGPC